MISRSPKHEVLPVFSTQSWSSHKGRTTHTVSSSSGGSLYGLLVLGGFDNHCHVVPGNKKGRQKLVCCDVYREGLGLHYGSS